MLFRSGQREKEEGREEGKRVRGMEKKRGCRRGRHGGNGEEVHSPAGFICLAALGARGAWGALIKFDPISYQFGVTLI